MVLITEKTSIEELLEICPESLEFLRLKGIRCIRCGEPVWGTLESVAKEKGFTDAEISTFVEELNKLTG